MSLYNTVFHHMSLYVTACHHMLPHHCMLLDATVCHHTSLYVTTSLCFRMPLYVTTRHCMSPHHYVSACHCMSPHVTACHHMSPRHCMLPHITVCHHMSLRVTMSLYAFACHCMSPHVTACQCMCLGCLSSPQAAQQCISDSAYGSFNPVNHTGWAVYTFCITEAAWEGVQWKLGITVILGPHQVTVIDRWLLWSARPGVLFRPREAGSCRPVLHSDHYRQVPLVGAGCFRQVAALHSDHYRQVPLVGAGCFRQVAALHSDHYGQVPLVGAGCFRQVAALHSDHDRQVPLVGAGCFRQVAASHSEHYGQVPLVCQHRSMANTSSCLLCCTRTQTLDNVLRAVLRLWRDNGSVPVSPAGPT